ncbi:outer membrane protein assembly factor BamB family protein [Sphingomicrobium aestuariivivum]|uniref:outer membrane protein assembly factor BamB family protein n=1 Tax=Sphingomicrobium aestuariivivum TaxID=1582356 RepID=UPI001FD70CFD|nr:PQQ-binding-like beta-propeller repeat protein [Sphingomicrobium aestuariivivum]MCJ8190676.1 PQQ-binding-like beta-propeller repeat protein [Sphingomicrobium aestuariivivum]
MTMRAHKLLLPVAMAALLSGCGVFKEAENKTPVLGERVAVLGAEVEVGIDATTAALPFALPAPRANDDWAQSGGNAPKAMGHLALSASPQLAWRTSIGEGSNSAARLIATPVVAEGRVYSIDVEGVVRAFDAQTGSLQWATQFASAEGDRGSLYGGGVAYGDGRLFATNGLGDVVALDPANGGIFWQVRPAGPLRGAPTYDGTHLYVTTQDNQLFALKPADGASEWNASAALEVAGVFGNAAPAAGRGTVVAGFSSGELNGYRYENGRLLWQDALSRTSVSTSVSSLSDIDADPVIDSGQVIAVGQGGRMVALDILSGQRLWELSIAGTSTPTVAGEWVFVVTDRAQLIAVARESGRVRWINQLPRFKNEEKRSGAYYYAGPVLAGGKLWVTSSAGGLIEIDPDSGRYLAQREAGKGYSLAPVVAGGTLYLLADDGSLSAYR